MVHLMRFLIVMASVVSLSVLSPRQAERMSRRTLKGTASPQAGSTAQKER